MKRLLPYSLVTAPLEVLDSRGVCISKATSFFYERDRDWSYLVTNWHVVTGRNPRSPGNSKTGAVPRTIRLKLHKRVKEEAIHLNSLCQLDIVINNEDGSSPQWQEHSEYGFIVDVIVIHIKNDSDFKSNIMCQYMKEIHRFEDRYSPEPMDNVFIIGYPWGLTGGSAALPLYKKGTIASEPLIDNAGLPRFLIDCQTTPALSGSPVICTHHGIWSPKGEMTGETILETVEKFVGVYSGRLYDKDPYAHGTSSDQATEIGIVWKESVLDQIVEGGRPGTKLGDL